MLILRPLVRFADFRGRARRAEYFGFVLAQAGVIGFMLMLSILSLRTGLEGATGFFGWLIAAGLVGLICFIPTQAVLVRRLHDSGKSTWFTALQLPSMMTPLVYAATVVHTISQARGGGMMAAPDLTTVLSSGLLIFSAATICNMILFLLMLLPGQAGPNRFGPDPRGGEAHFVREDRIGGMDEARLDSLIADAHAARGAGQTSLAEGAIPRAHEPDWRFRDTEAPAFGRRTARTA